MLFDFQNHVQSFVLQEDTIFSTYYNIFLIGNPKHFMAEFKQVLKQIVPIKNEYLDPLRHIIEIFIDIL